MRHQEPGILPRCVRQGPLSISISSLSSVSPSPPTPSTSHYEKPPCQKDETQAEVEGAGGSVCAPKCNTGSCPTDVPEGTTAKPMCILQDESSGDKYCALACILGGCPDGSKCVHLSSLLGVCIYPDSHSSMKLGVVPDSSEITV